VAQAEAGGEQCCARQRQMIQKNHQRPHTDDDVDDDQQCINADKPAAQIGRSVVKSSG
jgi:hypothetical protein